MASFRALIASVIAASALGFAPSSRRMVSSRLNMGVQDLPGATAPFGFFDPLNLSASLDAVEVSRYREAELKHGRVAMLAFIGILGTLLNN